MKKLVTVSLAVVSFCALEGVGQAQNVTLERQLSLSLAVEAAQTAVNRCRVNGFRVTAVVLDRGGNVRAILRDDATSPHTVDTARKKAFTSLAFRIPSADFIQRVERNPGLRDIEGTITLGGGLPIRSGGEVVAAIGVGGAPSGDADTECAQAGIEKISDRL